MVERFNVGPDPDHPGFSEMHPAENGRWVRWSEIESVVEAARNAAKDLNYALKPFEDASSTGSPTLDKAIDFAPIGLLGIWRLPEEAAKDG